MDWKTLKRIADDESITCDVDSDTGIVVVKFTVKGGQVRAQYSSSSTCVHAFTIWDGKEFCQMFSLDEFGEPLPVPDEKEPGCVFLGDDDDNED